MPNVKNAESALLTIERAQKLDLLIHLITNLRQSLVICGPSGIGKTTLLEELKQCEKGGVLVLSIPASSNLSFEGFQNQLVQLILKHLDFHVENQDVAAVLSLFKNKNNQINIIIDDAGQLVPGLISTLIQYANENKCLRIVFSLTQDEIQLKNSSDRTIEDCHFIEIPPLTKKQCGVFLQNLSVRPGATLSTNDINDSLIESLYKKTDGIPGAIISEVSKGTKSTTVNMERYKWVGFALIAAIALTLGGFFLFDESDQKHNKEKNSSYLTAQEAEGRDILTPYEPVGEGAAHIKPDFDNIEKKQVDEDFSQPSIKEENFSIKGIPEDRHVEEIVEHKVVNVDKEIIPVEKTESINKTPVVDGNKKTLNSDLLLTRPDKNTEHQKEINIDQVEQIKVAEIAREKDVPNKQETVLEKIIKDSIKKGEIKTVVIKSKDKVVKKKENPSKLSVAKKDESQWVLKQPENYYTMQLIVLSNREAVTGFLEEYPKLLDNLKFFQKRKGGEGQFVVIYGSFKDEATASKKMKSLPPRYKKAWVRNFSGLHDMIKK